VASQPIAVVQMLLSTGASHGTPWSSVTVIQCVPSVWQAVPLAVRAGDASADGTAMTATHAATAIAAKSLAGRLLSIKRSS
jgi:hypothetical protein